MLLHKSGKVRSRPCNVPHQEGAGGTQPWFLKQCG